MRQRLSRAAGRALAQIDRLIRRTAGRPLNPDPLIRVTGVRLFLRGYYAAFIDAHGMRFSDVDEVLGGIRSSRPAAWVSAWSSRADHYQCLARLAEQEGRGETAAELSFTASTAYRLAEMALPYDSDPRRALTKRMVESFRLGGRFSEPPLRCVRIPVGNVQVPAYLRVPSGLTPPPAVVVVPGLGMLKEHGDFPPEPLLRRGLATLVVDLPGQGESHGQLPMTRQCAEELIRAALTYLEACPAVDGSRLGLLGTSMGATACMFAAADDARVKAIVELSGFFYPASWWDYFLADGIKEFLRQVSGARDEQELRALVRSINLSGQVGRINCPLLVVHGARDGIVPISEARRIFADAHQPKEELIFPTGDHGCVNVGEARPLIADWLAAKLGHPLDCFGYNPARSAESATNTQQGEGQPWKLTASSARPSAT
ncbi:MAG: alpha/beta hydrolase [Chloroflexota bacterium]